MRFAAAALGMTLPASVACVSAPVPRLRWERLGSDAPLHANGGAGGAGALAVTGARAGVLRSFS